MSPILIITIGACCVASLLASVWTVAYRVGFDEGRMTIPLRMIHAVAEHQVACLDGDPAQTRRELAEHLCLPQNEACRVVERIEQARSPRTSGLRSA